MGNVENVCAWTSAQKNSFALFGSFGGLLKFNDMCLFTCLRYSRTLILFSSGGATFLMKRKTAGNKNFVQQPGQEQKAHDNWWRRRKRALFLIHAAAPEKEDAPGGGKGIKGLNPRAICFVTPARSHSAFCSVAVMVIVSSRVSCNNHSTANQAFHCGFCDSAVFFATLERQPEGDTDNYDWVERRWPFHSLLLVFPTLDLLYVMHIKTGHWFLYNIKNSLIWNLKECAIERCHLFLSLPWMILDHQI